MRNGRKSAETKEKLESWAIEALTEIDAPWKIYKSKPGFFLTQKARTWV